ARPRVRTRSRSARTGRTSAAAARPSACKPPAGPPATGSSGSPRPTESYRATGSTGTARSTASPRSGGSPASPPSTRPLLAFPPSRKSLKQHQQALPHLAEVRGLRLGLQVCHQVERRQPGASGPAPIDLLDPALQPVAHHGLAHLAARGDADPRMTERVRDQVKSHQRALAPAPRPETPGDNPRAAPAAHAAAGPRRVAGGAGEMAGPRRRPLPRRRRGPQPSPAPESPTRAGQDGRASDAQARPSLPAPPRQHGPAMASTHTHQEPMGPLAATVVRLVGAFHLVDRLLPSSRDRAGGLERDCSRRSERNQ